MLNKPSSEGFVLQKIEKIQPLDGVDMVKENRHEGGYLNYLAKKMM